MSEQITQIIGIDYGSKLAGTTVISYINENQEVIFEASAKNRDADAFILKWITRQRPIYVFLDAPLSLPGIYQNLVGYQDYFYREADRAVQAMSPMFLGGLTARAMRLKAALMELGIITQEVYPGYLAKVLNLDKSLYKKQRAQLPTLLPEIITYLQNLSAASTTQSFNLSALHTWHHFDALLALCSGIRYLHDQHLTFGNPEEGILIV